MYPEFMFVIDGNNHIEPIKVEDESKKRRRSNLPTVDGKKVVIIESVSNGTLSKPSSSVSYTSNSESTKSSSSISISNNESPLSLILSQENISIPDFTTAFLTNECDMLISSAKNKSKNKTLEQLIDEETTDY
jgi:hypothetical protein